MEHLARPLLISPIVLLALIGIFAVKGGPLEESFTSLLIAFLTGFAWRQTLEERLRPNI